MIDNYIQLTKNDVLKIGIKDENGNDTGNYLEFDLEDIELPLRIQQLGEEHKKNLNYLKMQYALIEKKEDKKGKKILSSREEDKAKALKEFYDREIKCLDLVLGEGGTSKVLNGRKPYFRMFDDIGKALDKLSPIFEKRMDEIKNNIIEKYKIKEEDVMEYE